MFEAVDSPEISDSTWFTSRLLLGMGRIDGDALEMSPERRFDANGLHQPWRRNQRSALIQELLLPRNLETREPSDWQDPRQVTSMRQLPFHHCRPQDKIHPATQKLQAQLTWKISSNYFRSSLGDCWKSEAKHVMICQWKHRACSGIDLTNFTWSCVCVCVCVCACVRVCVCVCACNIPVCFGHINIRLYWYTDTLEHNDADRHENIWNCSVPLTFATLTSITSQGAHLETAAATLAPAPQISPV